MISFELLDQVWDELPKSIPYFYKIGPFTVQISSTDEPLMKKLTRALAHLASESTSFDLTIRLWSGRSLPPLDWSLIHTNGYRGYAKHPFYFHFFEMIGALSAIDVERNIAYYAVRDPETLPWWVYGSPLQGIFHVWLREKGVQLTHSACITDGKSAVLLAGKGGSGKSTTVLACLEEGLSMLGEDYVLLSFGQAYSLYQTAKLELHTRTLFPSYEKHIANLDMADREKSLLYYKDLFPSQILHSAPIHGVVSLRVGASSFLQKSDFLTSLQSLLLSTVMQLPHPDPRTSSLLSTSMKQTDHYRLSLGPDLRANVALLRGLFR